MRECHVINPVSFCLRVEDSRRKNRARLSSSCMCYVHGKTRPAHLRQGELTPRTDIDGLNEQMEAFSCLSSRGFSTAHCAA